MKKACSAAAALFVALSAFAVEVDGIAARVGSSVILKSDVIGEMRRAGVGSEKYAAVRGEMIERELMLKAASKAKLQMQDWVVENRVREIVTRVFGGDMNRFKAALAKDRVTFPEWRQRLKDDMVVAAIRWQTIDKNVSANPSDMRKEYEAHPERYVSDSRVTVSAILVGPGDAEKKPEIEEALKTEPFGEVAKKYSSDARAKDGGQWKDVKPEDVFKPEICAEIAKMKKGETSKWIELDGWNFLIRKDDEKSGVKMTFEQAYDAVAQNVRREIADKRYREWIDRLKAETYIKVY
ncbi:MAG: peptidyl-prolyl cis-trans isomerase [Kiritimatiellae bacterium]|nr:peptidyl-prolyl cis-trans isomerase [Kiritimatiellia bacterium]